MTDLGAKPLIVTGMHRSGTSLLAEVIQRAGVDLGVPSGAGERHPQSGRERKGHFEDKEFVALHESIMARLDPRGGFLWKPPAGRHELNAGEVARAEALVARRSRPAPWGWKDPRTVLFLDFWREQLPRAAFLFVFRAPNLVVDSLRRRGDRELTRSLTGGFRYRDALEAWLRYNRRVLEFVERHPARSCLIHVDDLATSSEAVFEAIRSRLGIPLDPVRVSEIYDPSKIRSDPDPKAREVLEAVAETSRLHRRLTALAVGEAGSRPRA